VGGQDWSGLLAKGGQGRPWVAYSAAVWCCCGRGWLLVLPPAGGKVARFPAAQPCLSSCASPVLTPVLLLCPAAAPFPAGEEALRRSGMTFTVVRPGGLVNEPAGKAVLSVAQVWGLPAAKQAVGTWALMCGCPACSAARVQR
jgi:hypothetical protein